MPDRELSNIDKAFFELLRSREYRASIEKDCTIDIIGVESSFNLDNGELSCLHSSWEETSEDINSSNPDETAMTSNFAYCPDCDEDVSDEVDYNGS